MTNASEIFSLDYKIIHGQDTYGPKEIQQAKDYYKNSISTALNGDTVGKTTYLWTNELFHIIAALKASWELGCTVFAVDYNPGYSLIPDFKNFYEFVDVVIGHDDSHVNTSIPVFPHKPHVYIEPWNQARSQWATADPVVHRDWPAVTTHTSGTTGYPKLTYFSHQQVIDIARFQSEMNRMSETDVALHIKTLHHGSLFLNFAVPLLSLCKQHHCIHNLLPDMAWGTTPEQWLTAQLTYAMDHGVNRLMIPYDWIRRLPNMTPVDLKGLVTINTIVGPTTDEMATIFEKFNPKSVINMWGCTEVGSVFHSMTDRSNLALYNPNRFEIINTNVDFELEPDYLLLKWKTSDDWHRIADKFVWQDGSLFWMGRTASITVNDQEISIPTLKKFIEQEFATIDFSIVPDFERNQLYLAIYNDLVDDLGQINQRIAQGLGQDYTFSKTKKCNYQLFLQGMKPSQPLLLYMFRNLDQ